MPIYDYLCQECDHLQEDLYFSSWKEAPPVKGCPVCRAYAARKVIGTKNFIHPTISTLYGRPEPALGGDCFESYDHKRKVLERLGAIEASDRVQGAKLYQDRAHWNQPPRKPTERLQWGDPGNAESAKE